MRKEEEPLGPGGLILFIIVAMFACGFLALARDDIRAGRDAVAALSDPGGWTAPEVTNGGTINVFNSAPAAPAQGGGTAPQTLPQAGTAPGAQQEPGPWCHTPPADCAHYRVLGWCSFECVP